MEEGNSGNNSPFSNKLRRDEGEAFPAKEEQPRSSPSLSDLHDEPRSSSRNDNGVDDRREEEVDDGGRSAGSDLQITQVMSENIPALSLRVQVPQEQKADQTSDDMGGTYTATTPVSVEFQAVQHGHSEHLDPGDGIFNSENTIMSSTLGGIPELSSRNLLTDQSVQAFMKVQDHVSVHGVQQPNYNLPETHSSVELPLESYLPQNRGSQTQIADGFVSGEQLAGWLHLQQQFTMHDPTILSRSQDFKGQGYIHCDAVVPSNGTYANEAPPLVQFPSNVSQQEVGAYNMPSSVPMSFNAVPLLATFTNTVLPNLEASHLDDAGDPLGPAQMNIRYIDLVLPCRSQQFGAKPISPVQVAQNRTLVLNSIYDPMYEALGLPLDPHLRLFLVSQRVSEKFDPERWPVDGPNPNETNQNFRAVTMLVRRFNFEMAPGAPEVKMTTGAIIHTTEGLKMTVTRGMKPLMLPTLEPILKVDASASSSREETMRSSKG